MNLKYCKGLAGIPATVAAFGSQIPVGPYLSHWPWGTLAWAKERTPVWFVLDLEPQGLGSNYKHLGGTGSLRRRRKDIGQPERSCASTAVGVPFLMAPPLCWASRKAPGPGGLGAPGGPEEKDPLGRSPPGERHESWQSSQTATRFQQSLNKHFHFHVFELTLVAAALFCLLSFQCSCWKSLIIVIAEKIWRKKKCLRLLWVELHLMKRYGEVPSLVRMNMTLFGNRAFADVITWDRMGLKSNEGVSS